MIQFNPTPENPSQETSECFIGTAAAIALAASAAATAGGSAYAAHKAGQGAELQTQAATHAADLEKQSNDAALEFQKQQAALNAAQANATMQANYNQWRAHEQRVSDFGSALGLPARNIPEYQPLPQTLPSTQTTPTSGATPAGATPQTSFGNLSDPSAWMSLVNDTPKLTQWVQQGLGAAAAKPGLVDYYVGKIKGQPGANPTEQAGSATYWMQKLQADPNVTGIASRAAAAPSSAAGYVSTMPISAPSRQMVMTPALAMPTSNSFASFLG